MAQEELKKLNEEFSITDPQNHLIFEQGKGDLVKAILKFNAAKTEVYLHGAHITSFSVYNTPMLFLSEKAVFNGQKAIRGGIPIVFPQFGPHGSLPQHGFARNTKWEVKSSKISDEGVELILSLPIESRISSSIREKWPYSCNVEYVICICSGNKLHTSLRVTNTGDEPLSFTMAFHNYFHVESDISHVIIPGMKSLKYIDNQNREKGELTQENDEITFQKETDRAYLNVPHSISIIDQKSTLGRMHLKTNHNLKDAVVWNPWIDKASKMSDFGDEEYKKMVCVEAGCVGERTTVKPEETWEGTQILSFY